MFPKHCSDEQLLAHADRELRWWVELPVSWHLGRCWHCRGRLEELELQAHAISRSMLDDDSWLSKIADAKADFRRRQERVERTLALELPKKGYRTLKPMWLATAALLVAALGISAALWWKDAISAPPAVTVLAQAEQGLAALERAPVHQVFEVQIRQTKPVSRTRRSRLEVWSDGQRRFSSRLTSSDGAIQQTLWRPVPDREYILDAQVSPMVERRPIPVKRSFTLSQLVNVGLNVEAIEAEFRRWLESREWRPVGVNTGFASFIANDGRRLRASHCGHALCLSARASEGARSLELTVEIDPKDYRPRLQTLVLESPEGRVELSLRLERMETPAVLAEVVFQPPTSGMRLPEISSRRDYPATFGPRANRSYSKGRGPESLIDREIELHFALHRVKACEGEPIEIVRSPDGLTVRGLTSSSSRKQVILDALAELRNPDWLKVEIRAVDELPSAPPTQKPAQSVQQEAGPATPRNPVALDAIQRYLGNRSSPQNVAQFSNRAISATEAMIRQGWALRRLAETFGGGEPVEAPEARRRLQQMVNDHLYALHGEVTKAKTLVDPLWTATESVEPPDGEKSLRGEWKAMALALFRNTEALNWTFSELFAVSEKQTTESPEAVGQRAAAQLAVLESELMSAEQAARILLGQKKEEARK